MTVECNLTVSGIQPEESLKAFIKSYGESSKISHYVNKESQLNEYFKNKMRDSIYDNNINVEGLEDSFSLAIKNNRIEFSTTMPDIANAFEYGSDNIAPRRYIEPAVIEISNQMSKNIIEEAINLYNLNTRVTTKRR